MKIIFPLIIISILLNTCRKECEEPDFVGDILFYFTILDKSLGNNLYPYPTIDTIYAPDSLQMFDKDWKKISIIKDDYNNNYRFGSFYIYDQNTDKISFQQFICKTYYLYLNPFDTDTIKLCFESQENKCGSEFRKFEAYYNGNYYQKVDIPGGYFVKFEK